jgi:hypothetical protein
MYRVERASASIVLLILACSLTACRTQDRSAAPDDAAIFEPHEPPATDAATPPDPDEQLTRDPVRAERTNGSQHARITLGRDGFEPPAVELRRGVPAEVTFVRIDAEGCDLEIRIPDFEIETAPLRVNEPITVSLKPDRSGVYPFRCGTARPSGRLIVNR